MSQIQDPAHLHRLTRLLDLPDLPRVVDIGANPMNHTAPYAALLEAGLCRVTGFEPQADTLADLNARKSDLETYIPAAVGDGDRHQLNLHRGSGLASFLNIRKHTLGHLRGLKRAAQSRGTLEVETTRLDDLSDLGRIDLLKIDIQGSELSVFRNGTDHLRSVLLIQTEVNFFPLYDDQPGFGDVDVFLRQQGFLPHSFLHIENRIVRSKWDAGMEKAAATQMLDGDILYMRDLSRPDGWSSDDLARTALLVAGVYGFADVVLRCLDLLLDRAAISGSDLDEYVRAVRPEQ